MVIQAKITAVVDGMSQLLVKRLEYEHLRQTQTRQNSERSKQTQRDIHHTRTRRRQKTKANLNGCGCELVERPVVVVHPASPKRRHHFVHQGAKKVKLEVSLKPHQPEQEQE